VFTVFALTGHLLGCVNFEVDSTEYALEYTDSDSCAETDVSDITLPSTITVEAWVRFDDTRSYRPYALIAWPGALALWVDEEGRGRFSDGTTGAGTEYNGNWLDDGELHHVAGVHDAGVSTLYIDGVGLAYNTQASLGVIAGSELTLGCWAGLDAAHSGLIDEVRLSASARYTDEFEPLREPFALDSSTLRLWHADEGEGDVGFDATLRSDLELTEINWLPFKLNPDG